LDIWQNGWFSKNLLSS